MCFVLQYCLSKTTRLSGTIPTLSIDILLRGVSHSAIVYFRRDLSSNDMSSWTVHFPYDVSPTMATLRG